MAYVEVVKLSEAIGDILIKKHRVKTCLELTIDTKVIVELYLIVVPTLE